MSNFSLSMRTSNTIIKMCIFLFYAAMSSSLYISITWPEYFKYTFAVFCTATVLLFLSQSHMICLKDIKEWGIRHRIIIIGLSSVVAGWALTSVVTWQNNPFNISTFLVLFVYLLGSACLFFSQYIKLNKVHLKNIFYMFAAFYVLHYTHIMFLDWSGKRTYFENLNLLSFSIFLSFSIYMLWLDSAVRRTYKITLISLIFLFQLYFTFETTVNAAKLVMLLLPVALACFLILPRKIVTTQLIIGILLLASIPLFFPKAFLLQENLKQYDIGRSLQIRLGIWTYTLDVSREKPLLGWGIKNYPSKFEGVTDKSRKELRNTALQSHQNAESLTTEYGLINRDYIYNASFDYMSLIGTQDADRLSDIVAQDLKAMREQYQSLIAEAENITLSDHALSEYLQGIPTGMKHRIAILEAMHKDCAISKAQCLKHLPDALSYMAYYRIEDYTHPHNIFLETLIEGGAVNLALLMIFLITIIYAMGKINDKSLRVFLQILFVLCITIMSFKVSLWYVYDHMQIFFILITLRLYIQEFDQPSS